VNSNNPVIAAGVDQWINGYDVFRYFGKHTVLDGTD
jgi:hypothetical protein